ncbi:hypothetical protein HN51_021603, partial [Arachis hypogaea]
MDGSITQEAVADNNASVSKNFPANPPNSNDATNPNPPSSNNSPSQVVGGNPKKKAKVIPPMFAPRTTLGAQPSLK